MDSDHQGEVSAGVEEVTSAAAVALVVLVGVGAIFEVEEAATVVGEVDA